MSSLMDSMTENTMHPSIIEGASFRLTHDTASVMSASSTKRYLHQRVRAGVQHDQQVTGIRRQERHHLATADAEIRLMRRRLQKLEDAKQQESAVTKYDNKKGGVRRSSQCEDIKLDTITGKLIAASGDNDAAQSPRSSRSGSLASLDLDLVSDSEEDNDEENDDDAADQVDGHKQELDEHDGGGKQTRPSPPRSSKISPRTTESDNVNETATPSVKTVELESRSTAAVSDNSSKKPKERSNSLRTSAASHLAVSKLPSSLATRSSSFTSAKRSTDK